MNRLDLIGSVGASTSILYECLGIDTNVLALDVKNLSNDSVDIQAQVRVDGTWTNLGAASTIVALGIKRVSITATLPNLRVMVSRSIGSNATGIVRAELSVSDSAEETVDQAGLENAKLGCESSCQDQCQTTCVTSCEDNCQTACELSCQTALE